MLSICLVFVNISLQVMCNCVAASLCSIIQSSCYIVKLWSRHLTLLGTVDTKSFCSLLRLTKEGWGAGRNPWNARNS